MHAATDSKAAILAALRQQQLPAAELPLPGPAITYADRQSQFARALASVGGSCLRAASTDHAVEQLAAAPFWRDARQVCSLVPGLGASNVDLATIDDPHALASLDVAIVPGEFGVAENGAVWVTDGGLRHRATLFIAQHLVLVLPADALVDNMHLAYEKLRFDRSGFGVFISGPSKTADIEQSLVIGAHGPRSATVVLLES